MKRFVFAVGALCLWSISTEAQSVQLGQTITVTVTPIVQSINITPISPCTASGNNLSCALTPNNAGAALESLSFVTNPSGSNFTGTLVLGGTNAASFVWTSPVSGCTISGATLNCTNAVTSGPMVSLAVSATALAAGSYAITDTATP